MERITAAEYREMMDKPKSKYRAVKTMVDGIRFDSKAEANYYADLLMLKRIGEVTDINLQPRFPLLEPFTDEDGKKVRGIDYVADFLVTYKDGRQEVVDVKGSKKTRTRTYLDKKKWFKKMYPDLRLIEVYSGKE